jgi:ADP-ribose pyrophosphatase YjhB (NUDIX family)
MVVRFLAGLAEEGAAPAAAPQAPEEQWVVAAGVRVRRPDDFVLLVRPAAGLGAGRWSLPMAQMPEHATAEDTAARVLRDGLRMEPGRMQFAETLTLDHAGFEVVVNVFDAIGWAGEPRYAARDYLDAAWVNPEALAGVDVVPEVLAWLSGAEPPAPDDVQPEKLASMLVASRAAVFAAYEAIPPQDRERELDRGWAAVDVIAHLASAEAYYVREARRLLEPTAHPWRPFNTEQWEADRLYRARPMDSEAVARLNQVQTDTLKVIESLVQAQLAHYGARASGGTIRVGEAIAQIAGHDREHVKHLRKMLGIARASQNTNRGAS